MQIIVSDRLCWILIRQAATTIS